MTPPPGDGDDTAGGDRSSGDYGDTQPNAKPSFDDLAVTPPSAGYAAVDPLLPTDTVSERVEVRAEIAIDREPPRPSSAPSPGEVVDPASFEPTSTDAPTTERGPVDVDALIRDPTRSRVAGAVMGAAIGDAIGHPVEFVTSFEALDDLHGPEGLPGFTLWWEQDGRRFAPYTDDTQLAEIALRALLWGREQGAGLDATMRRFAKGCVAWSRDPKGGHRAPGEATLAGCAALAEGRPWAQAGGAKAGGSGSVMRAYPFGLAFATDPMRAERWAVAQSRLTHRDPIALGACAAMAVGVAYGMKGRSPRFTASEMVAAACRHSPRTAAMMAEALHEAESGVEPRVTLERLEGWAAHEAIAAAVYVFVRHASDPAAAILEAAYTPGDSDTLATLVGALVGAHAGLGALPSDWVRDVERAGDLLALATAV